MGNNLIIRRFPLPTIQSGVRMGNGNTGMLLWGEKNILNLTIGCASLWDHRGGMQWSSKQNYQAIRAALLSCDRDAMAELFPMPESLPSLIPAGRIKFTLPDNCTLLRSKLDTGTGGAEIIYSDGKDEAAICFFADMTAEYIGACAGLPPNTGITLLSSWELIPERVPEKHKIQVTCGDTLQSRSFEKVCKWESDNCMAFVQKLPSDPSYSIALRRDASEAVFSLQRDIGQPEKAAEQLQTSFESIMNSSRQWWQNYWQDAPEFDTGDEEINAMYREGLFCYGIATNPAGVPPGLQGPWLEDDRLPPWQGDYHFNINVQMCHEAGYAAGKFQHLKPLFDMILSWKDTLRTNARYFAGIKDGYMLPHAVDDRCCCMGNFWSGTIDYTCTIWVAQMMYDYCDYTGDVEFLRSQVYDFMCGVMQLVKVMIERDDAGNGKFSLPVSVSPEYGGAELDAWGRNSSFQIAGIHRLADDLLAAAEILGKIPDPFWLDIKKHLPYCNIHPDTGRIALWDGQELEESHRHHSHLAGLCPFNTIDPEYPSWRPVITPTIEYWTKLGMGMWTGWCMSWASRIRTRLRNADMAILLLKLWKYCFTNSGGGSLHDARFSGFTLLADIREEFMQLDGQLGIVTAVHELFAHNQNGVIKFFYGIPESTGKAEFKGIFLPGGFRASGRIEYGVTVHLEVYAARDALLKLKLPDQEETIVRKMNKGESIRIR